MSIVTMTQLAIEKQQRDELAELFNAKPPFRLEYMGLIAATLAAIFWLGTVYVFVNVLVNL